MIQEEKFKQAVIFMGMIPNECHPRIGGSCALWRKGFKEDFHDVDIIVDFLPPKDFAEDTSAVRVPITHEKRLNDSMEYNYEGVHIDIHESIMPRRNNDIFEDIENILYAQKILKRFFKAVYNEDVDKWKS